MGVGFRECGRDRTERLVTVVPVSVGLRDGGRDCDERITSLRSAGDAAGEVPRVIEFAEFHPECGQRCVDLVVVAVQSIAISGQA